MTEMTAVLLTRHGGPEALEVRTDWKRPDAGPGEVLVRVRAAAVNNTDLWTREGAYGLPRDPDARAGWRGPIIFPLIQGGDIVGEIVEVGPGGDPGVVGTRVVVDPAIYRDDAADAPPVGLLGSEADGGFAEYVVVSAARAHEVTDSPLTDAQLAALPVSYGTAMGMLERAGIASGESVVVTGASGGVGLALVQLAAARGARVIAVTSGAKAPDIIAAGATATVDRTAGDLQTQIRDLGYETVDAVADVAGGPMLEQLLPLVRDDGRWVIAGAIAGPVVDFDLRRLYLHNIRLIGSSMHTRTHFAALLRDAIDGTIDPVIAAEYRLSDIADAQEFFTAGRRVGKVVLTT